ncbi:hypothetical protein BD626DRAFT_564293 [Schizophyllum amplum]|uniref:Uncharacterized protein n=1 Tax=Schizophyllum amplum TaxID=97359 RepID=A0A550CR95_9AGAR|nr:hypothetical protein BD626DRAFT_564293 [Auriculariopsis ampla]
MYEAWNNVHGLHGTDIGRCGYVGYPRSSLGDGLQYSRATSFSYARSPPSTSSSLRYGPERHSSHRRTSYPYQLPYRTVAIHPPPPKKVHFYHTGARTPGLLMSDILYRSAYGLERMIDGADETVLAQAGVLSITICITWPGYEGYQLFNDIPIVSKSGGTMTRIKLARAVCKIFSRFIDEAQTLRCSNRQYRLGAHGLGLHQLLLLSITEASDGIWRVEVAISP